VSSREAAPDVFRIELPLPFELEAINIYLVRTARGCLLIDCGMDTPDSFAALETGLYETGFTWRNVEAIVLTHMHPDHIGLAPRVRELSGARIFMHAAEAEHLDSLSNAERRLPWIHAAYARAGVPADLQRAMDTDFEFVRRSLHAVRPDAMVGAGDTLESALGPLHVIETPGHSPGHICLYAAQRKLLFSGDHILNGITPNISWHPGRDALGEYLDALRRVSALDVELVLPSHGDPFSGHRTWTGETSQHHAARCGEIVKAMIGGPRTAHDIVFHLWPRPLSPVHHHFAVFEVMAHLEHMERHGDVSAVQRGNALEWSARSR